MSRSKTALMRSTEDRLGGQELETALGPLVTRMGLRGAADHLGLKLSTLNYWMMKFGIHTERIAILPGSTILLNGRELVPTEGEP